MAKILLDYVFPISVVETVPAASTAFLKQVCLVCKPKSGQEANVGEIYECATTTEVAARTDNTNATQLFAGGMSKVFILLADELDLSTPLEENAGEFWTVLVSDDYADADITETKATGTVTISSYANLLVTTADTIEVAGVVFTAQAGSATLGTATFRAATSNGDTATSLAAQINGHSTTSASVVATVVSTSLVVCTAVDAGQLGNELTLAYDDNGAEVGASVTGTGTLTGGDGLFIGDFDGVVGYSSVDAAFAQAFGATENRCAFFTHADNGADNMCYAFGKLLSNLLNWTNQQYVSMPKNDEVETLGDAESLFDDKVSFVINDTEFGNRLAFFVAGGKAIAAPYIGKNLRVDLQSRTLSWIAANQPDYTLTQAALLEQRLQEDIINVGYIQTGWISAGFIEVTLVEDNFVASGEINIAEPKALWRMFGEMRSSL